MNKLYDLLQEDVQKAAFFQLSLPRRTTDCLTDERHVSFRQ